MWATKQRAWPRIVLQAMHVKIDDLKKLIMQTTRA